ncbi:GlsB/YeaQ/YmgE family stress response membrane protein [Intrasporangium calvum]|uniref:GlsB/YeaQ/YmgE family stress response membrane protein n=1 Tax=Intrasporangium calvum TaxID=53358 RepID=A0ABT5GKL4_9MICO|nr:GlsB/YeaQ/YmgE family stress response membrane protein [Intrasporangium calvum]MDC5698613.1 GlsB/YeaQ/YmgE family stress response membrane protein [Intrasporangium calvum]
MLSAIIGAIIAGIIIGALGRLLLPGKQNISILMTIVIGIIASFLTTLILGAIFGYENESGGVAWWYWIVSAIVAAIGIVLYGRMSRRPV